MSRSCSLPNYSRSKAPHPSPLPEGDGADRGVLRHTSTWETEAIMDRVPQSARFWIQCRTFRSVYSVNDLRSVPSPSGRGLG
ncbi:hypothetical protein DCO47_21015 [Pseudomonas sp. NDM]|nr:hypothetical protein DCO47_21015 [Pseudomonas sp. NDM]